MIDRLSRAGTEMQLLALIRSLDRSRVQPSLCLLDGQDELSRSLEPDCPIIRLGLHSLLSHSTFDAARQLKRFWRRNRIEVLQTYFLDSSYFGVTLARLTGIRHVIRVRNNLGYWLTARHQLLGKWMGRLATLTLTNSVQGKDNILNAEGLQPDKLFVLENGVDVERFAHHRLPDMTGKTVRVGALANLRPVKNIDGLIRAAAMLKSASPHLMFEVAGDGEQRSELQRLIVEKSLEDRFHLVGAINDVPAFLERQDIAILCSHSEGMSNALLEYMASGRAIIATDVGANGQLVRNEVEGMLVPPKDDGAIAAAIDQLLRNPDKARQMAVAARRRAEMEFSRTAMVRRFETLYEQLFVG